jgi:hypothetical protein
MSIDVEAGYSCGDRDLPLYAVSWMSEADSDKGKSARLRFISERLLEPRQFFVSIRHIHNQDYVSK